MQKIKLNDLNPDHHVFEVTDAFAWKSDDTLDLLIHIPLPFAWAQIR